MTDPTTIETGALVVLYTMLSDVQRSADDLRKQIADVLLSRLHHDQPVSGQFGYRTALSRLGLKGRVEYTDRNLIEKWFHTLKMRIDCFHNSWVGSRASPRQWFEQFVHYYNHLKPHQSLDSQTPAEAVLN